MYSKIAEQYFTKKTHKYQFKVSKSFKNFFLSKLDVIDFTKKFDQEMCIKLHMSTILKNQQVNCDFCDEKCNYEIKRIVVAQKPKTFMN